MEIYKFPLAGGGPGGGSNLLYTRRIGTAAPIIGAMKLSGRTAGGTSYGLLGAATGADFSPDRAYGVLRGRQQFGDHSSAGAILTGYEGPSATAGRKQALTGGADWDLRFQDNRYGLQGTAAFTHQQWSTDPSPGQTGFGGQLEAGKRQGSVNYQLGITAFDSAFDPNDLGRQRRNNCVRLGGNVFYQANGGQPFGPFQRAFLGVFGGRAGPTGDGSTRASSLRPSRTGHSGASGPWGSTSGGSTGSAATTSLRHGASAPPGRCRSTRSSSSTARISVGTGRWRPSRN